MPGTQSTAPKYIFDHTVGSCSCQSYFCCGKNSDYYYKEIKDEESLKKVLKFHFMDPFEKWNSKDKEQRRFPWKLVIQIFSIIFVTLQVLRRCVCVCVGVCVCVCVCV